MCVSRFLFLSQKCLHGLSRQSKFPRYFGPAATAAHQAGNVGALGLSSYFGEYVVFRHDGHYKAVCV